MDALGGGMCNGRRVLDLAGADIGERGSEKREVEVRKNKSQVQRYQLVYSAMIRKPRARG
jgi:hypothetical protein